MSSVSPLLFLILVPIVTAALVMIGGNARAVSIFGSVLNLALLLALAFFFRPLEDGFQFVSSFPVVPDLGISFTLGTDGLSLVMLFIWPPAVSSFFSASSASTSSSPRPFARLISAKSLPTQRRASFPIRPSFICFSFLDSESSFHFSRFTPGPRKPMPAPRLPLRCSMRGC